MLEKVRATIKKYSLLDKGDFVLAAVSGGPDSTALLFLLVKLQKEYSLKLAVAHVNYHLRGKDSDLDLLFVKKLAAKFNLPLYVKEIKGKKELGASSLQDKARKARYAFFEATAKRIGAGKLAVAHNKNDRVETILMRFLRGSGATGLAGMQPARLLSPGVKLIRPLFELTREEIEKYLGKLKITARTDKSNLKTAYLRNDMRLKLLPLLKKEYNPKLEESLIRMSEVLSAEDELLSSEAKKFIREKNGERYIGIKDFEKFHPALKLRVLRELIRGEKGDLLGVENKHLQEILSGKKSVSITGNLSLTRSSGKLLAVRRAGAKTGEENILLVPGETRFGNIAVAAALKDMVKCFGGKKDAFLDASKINFPVFVRGRRAGDRFKPFGMKTFKKLQDFLVDEKVPVYKRDSVPLVMDARGDILWVAGCRPDERFKVTGKTKKILHLRLKKTEGA